MSKKQKKLRQKITNVIVSFLVLAAFILPIALSVRWFISAFSGRDPRKVSQVTAFVPRQVDQASASVKPFAEPLVSISFDDGWESVYTNALPILQTEGFHTTQYIITGALDNYTYMSRAQIASMIASGQEIGSHTISHPDLTQIDDDHLYNELETSRLNLESFFGVTAKDFTSPYGAYNSHTLEVIGKFYRSQKNAEGDPTADELEAINTAEAFNPLNFKSYSVRKTTTVEDLKKLFKAAKDYNGWLVLTYHQVDDSGETFSVTPQSFTDQLKAVSETNMRSATIGQVMDILRPDWKAEK